MLLILSALFFRPWSRLTDNRYGDDTLYTKSRRFILRYDVYGCRIYHKYYSRLPFCLGISSRRHRSGDCNCYRSGSDFPDSTDLYAEISTVYFKYSVFRHSVSIKKYYKNRDCAFWTGNDAKYFIDNHKPFFYSLWGRKSGCCLFLYCVHHICRVPDLPGRWRWQPADFQQIFCSVRCCDPYYNRQFLCNGRERIFVYFNVYRAAVYASVYVCASAIIRRADHDLVEYRICKNIISPAVACAKKPC